MHPGRRLPVEPSRADVTRNPLARAAWLGVGSLCTGLAFLGAVLPLLPTTPFLLLAAYAFARSSPRLYERLLRNRVYGPLIRDWRAGRGIPLRAKAVAVVCVVLTIGSSAAFVVSSVAARVALVLVGASICTFLVTRPTSRGDG